MSENDHTLERLSAYDGQDSGSNGQPASRRLLLIVALTLLAAFLVVTWFAYQLGKEEGRRARDTTATPDRSAALPPSEESASPSIDETAPSLPLRFADEALEQPGSDAGAGQSPNLDSATTPEPQPTVLLSDEVPTFRPGEFVIQVASRPTAADATDYFEEFRTAHPEIFEGKMAYLEQGNLGEQGIWHRLRIGPYPSFSAAESACAQIEAEQGDCLVATP